LVDPDAARAAARREIETGPQQDDPQFRAWRGAAPGEPRLVHDPRGDPSYWLVPVQRKGTTIGAVRVLAWRVEVLRDDRVLCWIFVTPSGIYQRAPPSA